MPSLDSDLKSASVFSHLTAEKAVLYRAILRAFTEARSAFALHLRSADVRDILVKQTETHNISIDEIESALVSLCEWSNLEAHRDTSDVATVEEFYRPRYLYQLTNQGEAAERAIAVFYEGLVRPGELQSQALEDIQRYLGELEVLASEQPLDEGKAFQTLDLLRSRFESLTSRAQTFMRTLQRQMDLQGIELDAFIAYKEKLIEYLERFIEGLVVATSEIAQRIAHIEAHGLRHLLDMAANREIVDAMSPTVEQRDEAQRLWQRRWAGFRNWFIGHAGHPSQADILRGRARSAVPALLATVTGMNERRLNRSDRVADLNALARWFSEAVSDADAHRLWRAAFCLSSTRHLQVDEATLTAREQSPVLPQVSWFDAPPIVISPRLRKAGRHSTKSSVRTVVDHSSGKALLARLEQDEAAEIVAAQARLANGRRMRLSEIGELDPIAFELFLELLGEVLVGHVERDQPIEADSSNGALRIRLEPTDDGGRATITTPGGTFSGDDYFVTITHSFAETAP